MNFNATNKNLKDLDIPVSKYGVLLQHPPHEHSFSYLSELVRLRGYAIVDSGYDVDFLENLRVEFEFVKRQYINKFGYAFLKNKNEHNTIRALFFFSRAFYDLLFCPRLLSVLNVIFEGRKFVLNQQNGVINPSNDTYNQLAWHRDIPYQHIVCTRPLAINALFCLDDFTPDNGATFLLPGSHKHENFPSDAFVRDNSIQITAAAGSFIILDCMLYHSGGYNKSLAPRRAVNAVYGIPFLRQQILIPDDFIKREERVECREILGLKSTPANTVADFLDRIG